VRLLLDTNVVLWALLGSSRVPATVRDAIRDPANEVFVSVVSAWEMAIKLSLGKLPVPPDLNTWLPEQLAQDGYAVLDATLRHVLTVEQLPRHHGDPFDRLLIAQAQVEGLTIVTGDALFAHYGVAVLRC
jgi:PIN domain nuclease of toxin-antitoxin system